MSNICYDKSLYLLPFDHRGSFKRQLFGWSGNLTPEQTSHIVQAKQVIYDGFRSAIALGVPKAKAGILVDEQFGAAILRDAAEREYTTCCSAGRSGNDELEFGDEFTAHVGEFSPTFCKVLARYNPNGDTAVNKRQSARLKKVSDYLNNTNRSLFMLELLVPPLDARSQQARQNKDSYDLNLRPRLMAQAIVQLRQAQVEPDIWKIGDLDRREDCERMVAAVKRGGGKKAGCIISSRGEDEFKVRRRIETAAAVPGFVGFAVGPTTFWNALMSWRQGRITQEQAVAKIAQRYREFVDIFEETAYAAA